MNWNQLQPLQSLFPLLIIILIIDLILRGKALWLSARANQTYWFIALLIINSIMILPLIYLLFFHPSKKR